MKQALSFIFILLLFSGRAQQNLSVTVVTSSASCYGTCNGSATVSASGGNTPYSYFWTPSGGTAAIASSLCAGSNSCIVTDADGRSATVIATVSQPASMQLGFVTSSQACNTLGSATVTATAGTSPYTYYWPQLSVTTSVVSNVAAGIYSVVVTGANACARTFTLSVPTVTTANFLTVAGPSTLCGNTYNTFSVSGGVAYEWSNNITGSVSTFYISNPASIYIASVAVSGTQAVTGCTTTVTHTMLVSKPNVTIAGPSTVCLYYPATLTASGASNFLWNAVNTGSALSISTTSNATYTVVGTDAMGCSDTAFHSVAGIYSPAFTINSGTICSGRVFSINPATVGTWPGGPVSMTVAGAAGTFTQSFGIFTLVPSGTQAYSVVAQASTGCVSTVAVAGVSVVVSPTLSAVTPSLCAGLQPTIIVSGSPSYTVTNLSANHIFALGVNASGCISDTLHIYPVIYPSPSITASSGSICAGSYYFIQTSGAASYSITGNSFSVSPVQTTTFLVTGLSSHGCSPQSPAMVTVSVVPIPVVSVNSGSICQGNTFTLVPSGASAYLISGGSFTVKPFVTTNYSLSGNNAGCLSSNTAIATITVIANPTIAVTPGSATICKNETLSFKATGATSYTWNGTPTGGAFQMTPQSNTTLVIYGNNANGCLDSLTVQIKVNECLAVGAFYDNEVVSVFPNPNSGTFFLKCKYSGTLRIDDLNGRTVYTKIIHRGEELKLNDFLPGIYFLTVQFEGSNVSRKIIVK